MTNTETRQPTPLVKWAGGKRQLLDRIAARMPASGYETLYEPFIGGGAVFLSLCPERAVINDINRELINLYKTVKTDPIALTAKIDEIDDLMPESPDEAKAYYYEMRKRYNELIAAETLDIEAAAMLVFINKHCFNGLYRVNAKGAFNVPYNGSRTRSVNPENVRAVSRALEHAEILCDDFEPAVADAKAGDFVFLDSPYAPIKETTFEAYTKEGFLEEDHRRLARLFRDLDRRGCSVMLTNHNTALIRELYDGFNIDTVSVKRAINSDASKRTGEEVIITNYEHGATE